MKIFILLFFLLLLVNGKGHYAISKTQGNKMWNIIYRRDVDIQFEIWHDSEMEGTLISIYHQPYDHQELVFDWYLSSITNEMKVRWLVDGKNNTEDDMSTPHIREIKFPVNMVTDDWHKPMLSIRDNKMMIVNDCKIVWAMEDFDLINKKSNGIRVYIGHNIHKSNKFPGKIREFSIDHGTPISLLCPYLDTSLFTKHNDNEDEVNNQKEEKEIDHTDNDNRINLLENEVDHIRYVVKGLVERIKKVELHQRGCSLVGGHVLSFGEKHQNLENCTECQCSTSGNLQCGPIGCPKLDCKHPITVEGKCCPICGKKCWYSNIAYHDGEIFWPKNCVQCQCEDGKMNCQFKNPTSCPSLSCSEEEQITPPNECCPRCKKENWCEPEHYIEKEYPCDENAICIHEDHGPKCLCKEGFFGNGTKCFDIDECHISEGQNSSCNLGTVCINMPGSYKCDCLPGFTRIDDKRCLDTIH
uniref:Epidermal growth factor-like domain-containing protein n=1 Tax=Strongyloides venezuelensis TaxID=75913 RepID=A0A0K0FVY4_STRVS